MKNILITGGSASGKTVRLKELSANSAYIHLLQQEYQSIKVDKLKTLEFVALDEVYSLAEFERFNMIHNLFDIHFIIACHSAMIDTSTENYEVINCDPMNLKNEFQPIRQWAADKGILRNGNTKTQYTKLQEENGELAKAILRDDKPEIKDAIGDMVVVLTSIAFFNGFTIEECINSAYQVIAKRKGTMVNNNFVKNAE